MAFNTKKFCKTPFEARTADIPVPAMSEWFDDAPPVWVVRGLSGNELGRCREMAENRKTLTEILQDLLNKTSEETVNDYIPKDVALWSELLILGSVDPVCDQELATKLNAAYPVEFAMLARKILELTGLGFQPGKQTPSGTTPASGQP